MNFSKIFIFFTIFLVGVFAKIAFLAVDVQRTFYPDGSLDVLGSNESKITDFLHKVDEEIKFPIISTKDSHPVNHISFLTVENDKELMEWQGALNITLLKNRIRNFESFSFIDPFGVKREQISWPVHGLKEGKYNSRGYWEGDDLLPGLEEISTYIQLKGEDPLYDSYSGFSDSGGHKTGLETYLKTNGFTQLIVAGEAGNYCVKATILDALTAGFKVILISDMTHYIPASAESETLREINEHAKELNRHFISITSDQFLKNPTSDFFGNPIDEACSTN